MKRVRGCYLLATVLMASVSAVGQSNSAYVWRNFVGQPGGAGSVDGIGSEARFRGPESVAVDSAGNVYVADYWNHTIRMVTSAGVVTTLAGLAGTYGTNDGTGSAARFYMPSGVAVDKAGNVYVADGWNQTIRRVTSGGVVTTLAGLARQPGSADGTGSAARFWLPTGLTMESAGNIYVADSANYTIRKVTSSGVVTTLAGSARDAGSADGTGSGARFNHPSRAAVDSAGNVFVADRDNHTIRQVTSSAVVTTLAGAAEQPGINDGTGSAARFYWPNGVAVDSGGNVFVGDSGNHTIRQVTSAGVVTTLAGAAGQPGTNDGAWGAARFYRPSGVAVDTTGNVYVADNRNHTIRMVMSTGVVTTLAGSLSQHGSSDGTGNGARFGSPFGVATDSAGNVYVADFDNSTIRKATSAGEVTTLAGLAGTSGTNDGTGDAARFHGPACVAVDSALNVYVADFYNHTIRKVTSSGVVTTLAGSGGNTGGADGTGDAARFNGPSGVALDGTGRVYVADAYNHTIRLVTASGVVATLAGLAGTSGTNDGAGNKARFYWPSGVAVDSATNVYVADYGNHTVRKVTSGGVVTTLAGSAGQAGHQDGMGSAARFYKPNAVAVDSVGNVYVADTENHIIRKVTSSGVVTTIGGLAAAAGGADGVGSSANFSYPNGIAVDSSGCLYVADTWNNRISKGTPLPYMACRWSGNSIVVSWPSPSAGFVLQENAHVASLNGWTNSSRGISDDGTNKSITITAPTGNLFLRLAEN